MNDELRTQILAFLDATSPEVILVHSETRAQFDQYHLQLFGYTLSCSSCGKKVNAAFQNMRSAAIDPNFNYKNEKMKNFKLKPNKGVYSRFAQTVVMPENCTDGNAIALLADNPEKNQHLFETKPENWRELVEDFLAERKAREDRKKADIENRLKAKSDKVEKAQELSAQRRSETKAKNNSKSAEKSKANAPAAKAEGKTKAEKSDEGSGK